MHKKEFDHHAVVALLKEKMCTVGHLAQKHRSVANVSWCLAQRTSTNNFLSHQSSLQKRSLIYVLYPTFASLFKTIESVTLAAFPSQKIFLVVKTIILTIGVPMVPLA